ncbi:MAG: nitroreductase family protein, partial [Clostridia bacterium]
MNVYDAIINRRSIRKFRQIPLERTDIERWINGARLAPQAANLQPVKYLVVDDPSLLSPVFDTTKWAAYLYPDHTPEPDQRPVAY